MKRIILFMFVVVVAIVTSYMVITHSSKKEVIAPDNISPRDTIQYPRSLFGSLANKAFKENMNFVRILEIGDKALLSRIHLARIAKKNINVQMFIWENDETGRFIMYELIQAAKRGVKVKVIVDQYGYNQNSKKVALLSTISPNFELKFYNPDDKNVNPNKVNILRGVLNLKKINQRMHNKMFVIDGQIGITGGRNHQNDYFDRGKKRNFKDRDVIVVGPVVREMVDSFKAYWESDYVVDSRDMRDVQNQIHKMKSTSRKIEKDFLVGLNLEELDQCASSFKCVERALSDDIFYVKKIRFIADRPGKNAARWLGGGGKSTEELADLITQAKEEVIVQTPYLVLDIGMRRFFKNIRHKKKDLRIVVSTNSLASADHYYAYAFSYKHKKFYLKDLKWRIFELKGEPEDLDEMIPQLSEVERTKNYFTCIHSKSLVIDRDIAYIGSFNLDPRSANLNTEGGFIIYDRKVAQALRENILRDTAPQNSWTIGKRREVPLISQFSGLMLDISKLIPLVDPWPFGYTESFQLQAGKEAVPFDNEDFYNNYKAVGPFPGVALSEKEIKARLTKALFGAIEPMI